MAMTKPTVSFINAFDSKFPQLFEFDSSGGNQVVKNKLIIRNNATNVIVYQNILETYKYAQTLPMNTLVNGTYYNYSFITYDINNIESAESNQVPFYCYTTPILEFTNITISRIIESSNFNFLLSYSQLENELVDTVEVYLYDSSNTVIANSGKLYNPSIPPITFNALFSGFEDNKNYKISAKGVTVNGTLIETPLIEFSVNYFQPSLYSILTLENVCDDGYVKIGNNMIIIDGLSNPSPPIYIANKEVDVTGVDAWVKWIEGYNITNNFTAELVVRDIKALNRLLLMSNAYDSKSAPNRLELTIFKNGMYHNNYLGLKAFSGNSAINNYIYTDTSYTDEQLLNKKIFIWIRRINNIFELKWEVLA